MSADRLVRIPSEPTQAQAIEQEFSRARIDRIKAGARKIASQPLDFARDNRSYLAPLGITIGGTVVAFLSGACGGDDDGVSVEPVARHTQVVKIGENGEVTPVVAGGGAQTGAATPTEDTRGGGGGKGVPESPTVKPTEVKPTNTPVPPTATNTPKPPEPTATNTPKPPEPTATPTPKAEVQTQHKS